MQPTTPQLPPLAEYRDEPAMQQRLADHFPTKQSFAWFVRRHRDRLVEIGALILVANRKKYHPELVEQVVLEAAHRAAVMAVEGGE